MQFLSQVTGWADIIIFAMAPLGIITAVVSAIRVSGPSWLKAIIGRAMESRAVVEAELMSSTSSEVCELWNGHEIVRIAGEGPICEFVVLFSEGDCDNVDRVKAATTSMHGNAPHGAGSRSADHMISVSKCTQEIKVLETDEAIELNYYKECSE